VSADVFERTKLLGVLAFRLLIAAVVGACIARHYWWPVAFGAVSLSFALWNTWDDSGTTP